MKQIIRMLGLAALAQLALAVLIWSGQHDLAGAGGRDQLLKFDAAAVDRIDIVGPKLQHIRLQKRDGWQVGDAFPADAARIDGLLRRLAGLQHGVAVALSVSAPARFHVADDQFERHLTLRAGDRVLADLYIGSGAGARQSYVRSADSQAVYRATIGEYEWPLSIEAWQDNRVLQLQRESIREISVNGVTLRRNSGKDAADAWLSSDAPAGKQLDQANIGKLLNLLQSLRLNRMLGTEPPAGFDHTPALQFDVRYDDGASGVRTRRYRFVKQRDGDEYLLKVSDRPEYVTISSYSVKALQQRLIQLFVAPSSDTASGKQSGD